MHRYLADHETTSITGAFFCCRKTTFDTLGGFSGIFPNSFQDVDFCLRARSQGLRCLVSPHIKLLHFESVSRNPVVDDITLLMIRDLHKPLIAPHDSYALFLYEKPKVPLFTLTAGLYLLSRIKQFLIKTYCLMGVYVRQGPSYPPFITPDIYRKKYPILKDDECRIR